MKYRKSKVHMDINKKTRAFGGKYTLKTIRACRTTKTLIFATLYNENVNFNIDYWRSRYFNGKIILRQDHIKGRIKAMYNEGRKI